MSSNWTVFVDRSFGSRVVADRLRRAGATVEVHDDHFASDAPDEEWLADVGKRGWICLTKDIRIGRSTLQRIQAARYGNRLFVFMSGNMTGPEMGDSIAGAFARMVRLTERLDAPFIAKVYASGVVKLWRDRSALTRELKTFIPRR